MDVGQLRYHLDSIAHLDPPGVDLIEKLMRIAEAGRWDAFESSDAAQFWRKAYETNEAAFKENCQKLVRDLYAALLKNSLDRLRSLSKIKFVERHDSRPVEEFQRLADIDNTLLRTAFAYKLVDLIEPAARRASTLVELVVKEPSSEEADQYLEEACQCYYFGLFTACVVMCRSLLEEVLERRLPSWFLHSLRIANPSRELTLGNLLYEMKQTRGLPIPSAFFKAARTVNEIGRQAAHSKPVSEDDASQCVQEARSALNATPRPSYLGLELRRNSPNWLSATTPHNNRSCASYGPPITIARTFTFRSSQNSCCSTCEVGQT